MLSAPSTPRERGANVRLSMLAQQQEADAIRKGDRRYLPRGKPSERSDTKEAKRQKQIGSPDYRHKKSSSYAVQSESKAGNGR